MMRRLVAGVLVAMLATMPLASATPAATVGQWGIAVWWTTEQDEVFMYWVAVFQGAATSAQGSSATVARVRCIEVKKDRLRCPSPRWSVTIPPTDFTIDPTMESATLDTTIEGVHHTLTWTAREEEPEVIEAGSIGEEESYHSASVTASARIRGEVFGRKAGPTSYWVPSFGRSAWAAFRPAPRFSDTIYLGHRQIEVVSR